MKKLITGILIGSIATISITAFAQYVVNPNPYPVLIDGETVDIEGYNINDKTYFQLRDVGDNVGFRVDFANDMILVNTAPLPTPTPVPTIAPASVPLPEIETEIIDGVEYVSKSNIEEMLNSIGLGDYEFSATMFYDKTRSDGETLLENIPHNNEVYDLIPRSYYTSTIVPVINSLR